MLYERPLREEFLRDNWGRGALIFPEERESVAATLGEIDGTDKRDRNQNNQRGKQGKNNHSNLRKMQETEVQSGRQSYVICFQ